MLDKRVVKFLFERAEMLEDTAVTPCLCIGESVNQKFERERRMGIKFDGVPLMPSSAEILISELFKKQNLWRRKDLVRAVDTLNKERGGLVDASKSLAWLVKKALGRMYFSRCFRQNIRPGRQHCFL